MGFDVRRDDFRVLVFAPHALQQDDATRLEFLGPHTTQQYLLVEGHHQVGFIATVGDVPGADADAVAAGTGDAARGRADFSRNDLGGPNAVAHLRSDGTE